MDSSQYAFKLVIGAAADTEDSEHTYDKLEFKFGALSQLKKRCSPATKCAEHLLCADPNLGEAGGLCL